MIPKEQAARHYWKMMTEVNLMRRAHLAYPHDAIDHFDELDVLSRYADWPLLRRLCLPMSATTSPETVVTPEVGA